MKNYFFRARYPQGMLKNRNESVYEILVKFFSQKLLQAPVAHRLCYITIPSTVSPRCNVTFACTLACQVRSWRAYQYEDLWALLLQCAEHRQTSFHSYQHTMQHILLVQRY